MELLDLTTVTHETFLPYVGQTFQVSVPSTASKSVPLELVGIRELGRRLPDGKRSPFSLDFLGVSGLRLPQGTYRFENGDTGAFEIFITQHGDGPQGSEFGAVFG